MKCVRLLERFATVDSAGALTLLSETCLFGRFAQYAKLAEERRIHHCGVQCELLQLTFALFDDRRIFTASCSSHVCGSYAALVFAAHVVIERGTRSRTRSGECLVAVICCDCTRSYATDKQHCERFQCAL